MYCSKCGTEMSKGDKFCKQCGGPVGVKTEEGVKILKLKCQSCNATMEYKADENIMFCPYCGSKNLVIESDKVKVTKIKKDIIVEKQNLEKEKRETKKMEHEQFMEKDKKLDKEIAIMWILLVFGVIGFMVFATLNK